MPWKIKYSDEAAAYLWDSWPYVEPVFLTIELLHHSENGFPDSGYEEVKGESNIFRWTIYPPLVEPHYVYFERFEAENRLHIWALMPIE